MFCYICYICFNNQIIIIDSSDFTFFGGEVEGCGEGVAFKYGILYNMENKSSVRRQNF